MTRTPLSRSKGQGHQAALVGFTGRSTWTYSNGDLSICVDEVYRVTTCKPGRGHIVAAARLQLVLSCSGGCGTDLHSGDALMYFRVVGQQFCLL